MHLKSSHFWILLILIATAVLGGCVTAPVNLQPAPPPNITDFKASLVANLVSRNYDELQTQMGSPFVIAYWQGSGQEMTPADAMAALQSSLLEPATQLTFVTAEVVTEWLGGVDPLTLWPETVNPVDAFGISGLGAEGKGQAILVIAEYPDGSFYWYAVLVAVDGFDGTTAKPPDIVVIAPGDPQGMLPHGWLCFGGAL